MKEVTFRIYTSKSKAKFHCCFITHMALTTIQTRHLHGGPTFGHPLENIKL